MNQPKIKRSYSVIGHDNSVVEFRQGGIRSHSHYLIDDERQQRLYEIVSHFKGEMTVKDIVQKLQVNPHSVERVIELLKNEDILEERPENAFTYYLDYMQPLLEDHHFSVPCKDVLLMGDKVLCELIQQQLRPLAEQTRMSMRYYNQDLINTFVGSDEDWPDKPLVKAQMVEKFIGWKNTFVVFVTRHYNPVVLQYFNVLAHECGLTWMNAMIDGPMILVGPLMNPDTACFECFESRSHLTISDWTIHDDFKVKMHNKHFQQATTPILKPIEHLLTSLVALDVTNYILTGSNHSVGKCMSIYLPTMETVCHDVYKDGQCSTCGLVTSPQQNPYFELEHLLQEQDNVIYFNQQPEPKAH